MTLLLQNEMRNNNYLNFFLIFCGAFLVFVNFYTAVTVLPLYITELGGSEFDAGLQNTLFFLASIILRFYFGPLTDRKGRKIPLMVGAFVFCTAPLLFLISSNLWSLTLARIYQAIGIAAFFSSGGTLVADMAPTERLGLFMGIFRLMFTLALLSGPSIALLVIDKYNFTIWFIISFLIGLLALGLISLIKTPAWSRNTENASSSSFKAIVKDSVVWPIYGGIALTSLGYGVIVTFVVLYISKFTQITNPGIYFTYLSLAGIVANLSAGYLSDRFGRPTIVWPAVILLGIGIALLFYLPGAPLILMLSSIIVGLGVFGGLAALIIWLVDVTDKENRGTVLALQESTIDLAFGMGSFVFGVSSGWIGIRISFLGLGLGVLLLALLFFIYPIISQKLATKRIPNNM